MKPVAKRTYILKYIIIPYMSEIDFAFAGKETCLSLSLDLGGRMYFKDDIYGEAQT